MGFDPGVFGRFDLAALVQPHLNFYFVAIPVSGAELALVRCNRGRVGVFSKCCR